MAQRVLSRVAVNEALVDLSDRWRRARRAALVSVAPPGTEDEALLAVAFAADGDEAMRKVFDNSLRLGQGYVRTYRGVVSLEDLPAVLSSLGVPCLTGAWIPTDGDPGHHLDRAGCAEAPSKELCDFYREAVAGMTLGLTGEVRHARHASLGRGDARCLDVFYERAESPLRFGPLDESLREPLEAVRRHARAFDSAANVEFLGVSEGVLIYRIDRRGPPGNLNLQALVERSVRKRVPRLTTFELAPRPVLDSAE